jgi:hypothetical protein
MLLGIQEVNEMAYQHTNSRGQAYWLHKRVGKGGATLFFFSKDSSESIDLPEAFNVVENPRTGLPLVKKK